MQRITKDRHLGIEGPSRNVEIEGLAPTRRYKIITTHNKNVKAYERRAENAYCSAKSRLRA